MTLDACGVITLDDGPKQDRQPIRILIVEDDPVIRLLLSKVAGMCHAQWREAVTLGEALSRLALEEFDLVLLDCHLPDGHGAEVVEAAKAAAIRRGGATQVIAISSDSSIENAERMYEAGANLFLAKPVPIRQLVAIVAQCSVALGKNRAGK